MVSYVVLWINCLSVRSGISNTLYPHTIMTRTTIYFNRHRQLKFGTYSDMHECQKLLNSQKCEFIPEYVLALQEISRSHTGCSTYRQSNTISAGNKHPSQPHPTSLTVSSRLLMLTTKTRISTSMITSQTLPKALL